MDIAHELDNVKRADTRAIVKPVTGFRRVVTGLTSLTLIAAQLALPMSTEASHLGSATASAGSAPPPGVSAIQSFQPDLFTGRATTSIPIAVPPGRKGMQPSLALAYSSSGRNSWVGVGWSLDAGYIERSTKNGVPKYDASDTYTFMFQGVSSDLVQIPDGTYRAKDEGLFLRFESTGLSGWEVRDKSGTRYFFGQTVASQIESGGQFFRWALEKVLDPNGNTLTITYTKDRGQLYPAQIRYTAHEPTALAAANQVDVVLEDRSDVETSYRSGFAVTTAKRLKTIDAKATVGGVLSLARRYTLAYATSARTSRSLLSSVTQVGMDGLTGFPPVTFTYQQTLPTHALTSPTPTFKALLAGDIDGNATTDFINFEAATGTWTAVCTQFCALGPSGTWLTGFGNAASTPLVGDWNGDGKTDVATFASGAWQFATSTGTSFQANPLTSLSFGSGTPLSGDFNGDGKTDVGTYANGTWSIALATGSAFSPAGAFGLTWGDATREPLTGDFNGDGLTDIGLMENATGNVEVRLSTGTGWTAPTPWISGFGPNQSHTSADFTDDGLSDLVYYDRTTGRVMIAPSTGTGFGAIMSLPATFTQISSNDELQVGDFNGDGLMDAAVFNIISGSLQLATSQGGSADLLLSTANGLGGTTSLAYQPSTALTATTVPFATDVVTQVTASDGLGNSYAATYSYTGGVYDAPTKEFRGFAKAKVIDAENNVALTQFHQDEHKKGRAFHTEVRDAAGNLWTKADQTWSDTDPYPGVHFTKLDQTDSVVYDGDATFKQTRSRLTYDQYGNVTQTNDDGDVAVVGDERTTTTAFVYNTTAWILNKPSLTQTLDAGGTTVVAQRRFSYDGAALTTTVPTAGLLTKEEEWRNLPTEQWLATTLTYDAYGNVASVTDALGRTTTNTYDATGTYVVQIANILGHTRQLAYDPRIGQVTSSTDQNGVTTTTEYDAVGRVTKVIGPTDTAALPTISYAYDLSTVPAKTTATTRIKSGAADVLTVSTFTDGLGRTIQTRSPAKDPTKQVVTGNVQFNTRGLVIKQWVPYLSTVSTAYVPVSAEPQAASLAAVTSTYDPLGRTLTITDPDGSVTRTSFSDWVVTLTDANGHKTIRTHDAYGRLSKVEELNQGQTYTTMYQYDALNRLTTVTDHAGNVTTMAYDSLGRKLSMTDPDKGKWVYAYDAVDHLTQQTDARGVTITFTYDALNRLTQKSYTIPAGSSVANPGTVTYTFDNPAKLFSKGKLTEITDGSGSSSFEYDTLGRLIKESKTIDGTTSTIQRSYDLLGRLTALTYPDGEIAQYTYNAQGGIDTVSLQPVAGSVQPIVSNIDYNTAGQITKIAYGNGVVSDYTYNPLTLRLNKLQTTGPAGALQNFTYSYDLIGNVTNIQDTVHTGTQSFQYDALNRLTQAIGGYGTVSYAYNAIGNMTAKEGVTMTYGLADGSKPHAVTSTSDGWTMQYDTNGNLTKKVTQTTDATAQYLSYDAEERLVEVKTAPDETVTLTFKQGWNFFSLPVIPNNLSISAVLPSFAADFEQVAKFEPATNGWTHYVGNAKFDDFTSFEYGTGYQVYCTNPTGVTLTLTGKLPTKPLSKSLSIGWHLLPTISLQPSALGPSFGAIDSEQILRYDTQSSSLTPATQVQPGEAYFVKVRTASTWSPPLPRDPTTRFVYDGDGGKVKQVTPAGPTRSLGEVFEQDPSGTTTKYLFAGSERLAAKDSTGALRYYHGDHLGSSNVVTDGTGAVVELAEYAPYGTVSRREGAVTSAHKFTGQRQDPASGLVFFPGRVYDPALGRFLQADPFVQDPADPQMLNRYSYVRNNPLNFVDPSGYKKKHRFLRILAIAAAVVAVVAVAAAIAAAIPAVASSAFATSSIGEGLLAAAPNVAVGAGAVAAGSAIASATGSESNSPRGPPATAADQATGFGGFAPQAEAAFLPVAGSVAIGAGAEAAAAESAATLGGVALAAILLYQGAQALRQALDEQFSRQTIEGYHTTSAGRANLALATGNLGALKFNPRSRAGKAAYFSSTVENSVEEASNKEATLQVKATVRILPLSFTPSDNLGPIIGFGARLVGLDGLSFPSSKDPTATIYAVYEPGLVKPVRRVR